eukprot:scaffold1487_cov116-Isochrysis_galbana.AAC.26
MQTCGMPWHAAQSSVIVILLLSTVHTHQHHTSLRHSDTPGQRELRNGIRAAPIRPEIIAKPQWQVPETGHGPHRRSFQDLRQIFMSPAQTSTYSRQRPDSRSGGRGHAAKRRLKRENVKSVKCPPTTWLRREGNDEKSCKMMRSVSIDI